MAERKDWLEQQDRIDQLRKIQRTMEELDTKIKCETETLETTIRWISEELDKLARLLNFENPIFDLEHYDLCTLGKAAELSRYVTGLLDDAYVSRMILRACKELT